MCVMPSLDTISSNRPIGSTKPKREVGETKMKKNGDTAAGHTEREGIKIARIDGLNEINGAIYDAQVAKYSAESGFEYDRVTIAQKRLLNKMIKKMWLDQDQKEF